MKVIFSCTTNVIGCGVKNAALFIDESQKNGIID